MIYHHEVIVTVHLFDLFMLAQLVSEIFVVLSIWLQLRRGE